MSNDLYVGVYPENATSKWLDSLVNDAPFSVTGQKFHVTVIYCTKLRAGITFDMMKDTVDPDKEFVAFADSVKIIKDHKKRDIIILAIRSTGLLMRHRFWNKQGGLHSYIIWMPHITLSSFLSPEEVTSLETQQWMKDVNRQLSHKRVSMLFTNEKVNRIIEPLSLESSLEEALADMKNPLRKKRKLRRSFAPPMKRAHLAPLKRVGPVPKEMKEMKMPRLTIKRPYLKKQREKDKERHERAKELEDALMEV